MVACVCWDHSAPDLVVVGPEVDADAFWILCVSVFEPLTMVAIDGGVERRSWNRKLEYRSDHLHIRLAVLWALLLYDLWRLLTLLLFWRQVYNGLLG
jgi:hypothetical protein